MRFRRLEQMERGKDSDDESAVASASEAHAMETLRREEGQCSSENAVMNEQNSKGLEMDLSLAKYGTEKLHPLLIDHILDKIFGYFMWKRPDRNNVINFRLVCRLWRERVTLLYRNVRTFVCLTVGWSHGYLENLAEFLKTMHPSLMIPAQRYRIVFNEEVLFNSMLILMLEEFFKICGPGAVEIHLRHYQNCKVPFGSPFHHFFNPSLKLNLENLKILGVSFNVHENERGSRQFLKLVGTLLEFAINLETLKLKSEAESFDLLEIFHRLPPSLKRIQFKLKLTRDIDLDALASVKNLGLEECNFYYVYKTCQSGFKRFLLSQGTTMKKLTLRTDINVSSDTFPDLPQLTNLTMAIRGNFRMSFLDAFPRLTFLELTGLQLNQPNLNHCLQNCTQKFYALEELNLNPLPWDLILAVNYQELAKLLPNLKRLSVSLYPTEENVRGIFTYFTGIQELSVSLWYKSDFNSSICSLLSGVDDGDLDEIMESGEDRFEDVRLELVQRHSSILMLTELQKLSFIPHSFLHWMPKCYGDFLTRLFFSKMENLEELHLYGVSMSSASETSLKNKLKVVNVLTEDGSGYDDESDDDAESSDDEERNDDDGSGYDEESSSDDESDDDTESSDDSESNDNDGSGYDGESSSDDDGESNDDDGSGYDEESSEDQSDDGTESSDDGESNDNDE